MADKIAICGATFVVNAINVNNIIRTNPDLKNELILLGSIGAIILAYTAKNIVIVAFKYGCYNSISPNPKI